MMKVKRMLVMLLSVLVAFSFFACGKDSEKPIITLDTTTISYEIRANHVFVLPSAKVTDNVDEKLSAKVVVKLGDSEIKVVGGKIAPEKAGEYKIIYSAVDAAGNVADSKEITLKVVANQKPIIKITNKQDSYSVKVNNAFTLPLATVEDDLDVGMNYSVEVKFYEQIIDVQDGAFTPTNAGNYKITYKTLADSEGLAADAVTLDLVVIDDIAPTISVDGVQIDDVFTINKGIEYTIPAVTVNDNTADIIIPTYEIKKGDKIVTTNKFIPSEVGTYTVSVKASDSAENSTIFSYTLNVIDIDLGASGKSVLLDFDKNLQMQQITSSAKDNSTIVKNAEAIDNNSLKLDFSANLTVKFMEKTKFNLEQGSYKVSFDYKFLSETKPDYFCVGFVKDTQLNKENLFAGNSQQINQTYSMDLIWSLAQGEYCLQIFNLKANSSVIVIDNIKITRVSAKDSGELSKVGGNISNDFDLIFDFGDYLASKKDDVSMVDNEILGGKALQVNYENAGVNVSFFNVGNKMTLPKGCYKITFDYILLDERLSYFCVGFVGAEQVNKDNWFSGRTDEINKKYTFNHEYTLNAGDYYIHTFNYNPQNARIIMDNFKIENIEKVSIDDLKTPGGVVRHNFDDSNTLGNFVASDVNQVSLVDDKIDKKSLIINFIGSGVSVKFLEQNKVALAAGKYKIEFDYMVTSPKSPNYFCVGFIGSAQSNRENWFYGKTETVNTKYTFSHEYTLAQDNYCIQIFNLNADNSTIIIDNIKITNMI